MKCAEFKDHLSEYMDGELVLAVRKACEDHLAACPDCRKAYQNLRAVWQELDHLPEVKPSPGFVSEFWTRVASQTTKKDPWAQVLSFFSFKYQMGFAALVLGALIVVSVVNIQRAGHGSIASVDLEFIQNIELAEHFDDINEMDELRDAELIQVLDEFPTEKG